MKVKFYFQGEKIEVEIDNDENKAKRREREFILYTFLFRNSLENPNGDNDKKIPPSARTYYISSIKTFFEEIYKEQLVSEKLNPFSIDDKALLNRILENFQTDDTLWKKITRARSSDNRRAFLNHYIDFVEKTMPQIFWLNVSKDRWENSYPFDKWQLGQNGDEIYYDLSDNIKKDDIGIFYLTDDKAIKYIGRVYKIDDKYVYFEILLAMQQSVDLNDIRKELKNYPPTGGSIKKIGEQQAGLEILLKCFKENEKYISANKTMNDNIESTLSNKTEPKIPLNQILYGPPGTGKTYSTVDKALEILKSFKCIDEIPESREEKREIFNAYKEKGQIKFITFHQSFSYEEFVEGIKPVFVDENGDEVENSKNMIYKVKDGIFKEICDEAKQNIKEVLERLAKSNNKTYTIDTTKTLWRLYTIPNASIDNDYFDECIENNYVKVSSYNNNKYADRLKNEAKEGDYIAIPNTLYGERSKTIRAFGVLKGMKEEKKDNDLILYFREVEWLWIAEDNILKFEINFGTPTFQRVKTGKEKILEFMQKLLGKKAFKTEPHILIIDEINRGNISKILGELITLIEESKRIGEKEELKVRLPYSTEEFGVPSNLYIIGTMNTADRSIALLDTALRRRFEFVEMMPDFSLLSVDCEGVNLQKLLKAMNDRIEFLLDREHTIGHSFFINVGSIGKLKEVFAKKIIPLLQEYFYEDYAKINAVLNDNKMVKSHSMKDLGVKFGVELVDEDKKIYRISNSSEWGEDTFTNIYSSKSNENDE